MGIRSVRTFAAVVLVAGLSAASNPASPNANATPKEQTSPSASQGKNQNLTLVASNEAKSGLSAGISVLSPVVDAAAAAKAPRPGRNRPQIGKASWYGGKFHGRKTANGESYDMYQFTAAHRSLPLGSWVKVTNLRNSKWVIVRVNDRGPWIDGRIMDMSYGAAIQLDLPARGVEKVKLELVEPEILARVDMGNGIF